MRTWQMKEAQARLSKLVKLAQTEGPQAITLRGKSVAVVLASHAFEQLSRDKQALVDFMRQSPLHGLDEIEFERDQSGAREEDL
ncbi:type II toxin-antitoxin system Phd/YefM family antitoxin [Pseudoduganella namucuonensis]|uniref:Antitoxin n=1 Tax=Pseudoduganella namucuonensis TaxID=1035707 RepID=A0A1I7LC83_9BURK|nr:type II toxin-antitoxin system Phd/YefM family antitoxin [Pseudoduganella namucuonensis]SFV07317.1 prevent-host-death family protein [Pseudoduganella namucuonensis]